MTDARMNRRLGAMLALRLEESGLDEVPDARDPRGIRWALGTLLRAVVVGVAAGAEIVQRPGGRAAGESPHGGVSKPVSCSDLPTAVSVGPPADDDGVHAGGAPEPAPGPYLQPRTLPPLEVHHLDLCEVRHFDAPGFVRVEKPSVLDSARGR